MELWVMHQFLSLLLTMVTGCVFNHDIATGGNALVNTWPGLGFRDLEGCKAVHGTIQVSRSR